MFRQRRRTGALAALALAALAVVAVPRPAGAQSGPTPPKVKWGECPEDVAAPGLECSTLDVPLDYGKPDGKTIEIAISRLASPDASKRRGILLTNPGGPGGSGLLFPALLKALKMPQSILERYDVIGLDPRGVGRSTPVTCDLTDGQKALGNLPPYAKGPADVVKHAKVVKKIAARCATSETADLLPHITTANTARDMDFIRQTLGEPKLSYLGYSYGSYLGAVYTTLFPQQSDRIVIDSVLSPGGYDRTATRLLARGAEDRFPDFAKWLAARDNTYGQGNTPKKVRAQFFRLATKLEKKPQPWITSSNFRGAHLDLTYAETDFDQLAKIWQGVDTGKEPELETPAPLGGNFQDSYLHVICNDGNWSKSVRSYQRSVEIDRKRYPMLGASTAGINACAFWPTERKQPAVKIGDRGPSNVLLVQNTRDPGTPLVGARKMRRALGNRAVMVTADQGGHGTYLFGKNTCATETASTFLATGRRPAHDLACK